MAAGIQIQGLAEFRRDLRRAGESTKDLTAVMKKTGQVILARAEQIAPKGSTESGDKHPGKLAWSGRVRASGTKGRLVWNLPYAAGAEFGTHGKWTGFDKWGPPPRFGYRALEEKSGEAAEMMAYGMEELVSVYGWFHR
jgi:hypothetical protein